MATSEVIVLLKKYISLLIAEDISVKKAFLFGSYSNNSANENSDIDIMIVSDNINENNDIKIGEMWKLTRKVNTKIEPFLIGLDKYYNDENSPLISSIKANGIEIY